jgi:hypothetical protein
MSFRGFWGKAFGQYGIWPLNFLEMVTRNTRPMTGASATQRAAWATKLAMTWTAIELALEEVAGIDASRMTWINPLNWMGGPVVHTAVNTLKLLGGTDFERDIAWARLKRDLWSYVPGAYSARDWIEAVEAGEKDPVAALILATGAQPIDPADAQLTIIEKPVEFWNTAKGAARELERLPRKIERALR